MKKFALEKHGTAYSIQLTVALYSYGNNLAIEMIDITDGDPEPWSTLTVNLDGSRDKNCAFIDTNNNGSEILAWMIRHGLATPTGRTAHSGYCVYPEYRFKPSLLEECDPDGYADYLRIQGEK